MISSPMINCCEFIENVLVQTEDRKEETNINRRCECKDSIFIQTNRISD